MLLRCPADAYAAAIIDTQSRLDYALPGTVAGCGQELVCPVAAAEVEGTCIQA